jgi:transmembrane sensor
MTANRGTSGSRAILSAEDLHRIEQYIIGELPATETAGFEQWVASDPRRRHLVDVLTELWAGSGPSAEAFNVQGMWARALPRVRQRRRTLSLISDDSSGHPRWTGWAAISHAVAAALLVSSIALAGRFVLSRVQHRVVPSATMRTFATRRGQRANLQLDDGTQAVLGAATTVQIPDDYGDHARNVYLDGEAFFIVRHDAARPFAVHAGHTVVRDIGTEFAVTAYPGTTTTRVVVAAGKVSVAHTELDPSDVAVVDSSGESAVVHHRANVSAAIAWAEGRFAYEATPFRDVAASLSRWYDLDIQLADSALGRQPLTVAFGSESTRQVLDALALLTHTRYEQHGRTATFYAVPKP